MSREEFLILRCVELARHGLGYQKTNPLVGSLLLVDGCIDAEGWHRGFGQQHAEVEVLNQFRKLNGSKELFVSLEPCSHFGKTPPCADRILRESIDVVHIGCKDPNPIVSGRGIEKLLKAEVQVKIYDHLQDVRNLILPFRVSMENKSPYIILKWAESSNQKIGIDKQSIPISGPESSQQVHILRNKVDAIMVGNGTLRTDKPKLSSRISPFKNPAKVILDLSGSIPSIMPEKWFTADDFYFTKKDNARPYDSKLLFAKYFTLDQANYLQCWYEMLQTLYTHHIGTLLVEGGSEVLHFLIQNNLWDEIICIQSNMVIANGIPAPLIQLKPDSSIAIGEDLWSNYINPRNKIHNENKSLYFPTIPSKNINY